MKVNLVNHSKKELNKKTQLAPRDIQLLIDRICDYFLLKKLRNRQLLVQKNELIIVFLSSTSIKKINSQFRKKNKPTDILSFSGSDPESLGELLLCIDVLKKQARIQKHSLKLEITYMLIHGILHLLGYDHEFSAKEEKLMYSLQDKCFKDLAKG